MISVLLKPIVMVRNVTITGEGWAQTLQKSSVCYVSYLLLAENCDLRINVSNTVKNFTEQTL